MPSRRHSRQTGPVYLAINPPESRVTSRESRDRCVSSFEPRVPSRYPFLSTLDSHPSALRRPAAVVRNRRRVGDRDHLDAACLQRPNRHLPTGTWTADIDVHLAQAVVHRLPRRLLSRDLRRIRRALAGPLEPVGAGTRPGQHVAGRIGQRDDGVVECGLDIRPPARDVLPIPPPNTRLPSTLTRLTATSLGHLFLTPPHSLVKS